jgi:hypothetical protein
MQITVKFNVKLLASIAYKLGIGIEIWYNELTERHAVDRIEIKNRVLCAKNNPLGWGVVSRMSTKNGKLNLESFKLLTFAGVSICHSVNRFSQHDDCTWSLD